jgi:O-antigen ligase
MIRLSALAIYVMAAALYAWKDWYKSLCALILLMAVVEHPDMPKSMLGIQGLNPWNLLLLVVVAAWLKGRRDERLTWDLPRHITVLLVLYLGVILVGFARLLLDQSYLDESVLSLTSEHLVNTVKWVIPGLMLFDGCRSRERLRMAYASVLGVYLLLGIQVIRWMPLSAAVSGDSLSARSLKILLNEVGYHRVNMAAMLAGASWAIFASLPLMRTTRQRVFVGLAGFAVLFAQALTGGRAGYATCAMVGFTLAVLRWRRLLLLGPVAALAIVVVAPGVVERMFEGFSPETHSVPRRIQQMLGDTPRTGADSYTITAGRIIIWPYVIDKILDRPFTGYGRLAMTRTGLAYFLATQLDEGFAHPHNAYLEMLFDNGIIGFVLILPFYGLMLWYSLRLFKDSRSPVFVAVGGSTFAVVTALLIAAMGSQTFYPREGWVGMWCLIFLTLRLRIQRDFALADMAAGPQAATAPAPVPPGERPRRIVPLPVPAQARTPRPPVPVAARSAARPRPSAGASRRATQFLADQAPQPIPEELLWADRTPPKGSPLRRPAAIRPRPVSPLRRGVSRAR